MIVFDSFIDSLGTIGAWFGFNPRNPIDHLVGNDSGSKLEPGPGKRGEIENHQSPPTGFFNNANNFVINNLQAYHLENVTGPGVNAFLSGNAVLQNLSPHTNLDAVVDSSARWPPPSCHPGTRVTICNRLLHWLSDAARQWSFIWLYGSAGCGKSAVAQTFAEKCLELGRLGASFFFSRPNKCNDPKTVIPTIAYQLAVHCSAYKAIINSRLADDPSLLSKAIPVQFRKLIVEPFAHLQRHDPEAVREPFLIILDGLDECDGEVIQCEFIRLINELVRVKKDFPLLWVIVSRQEAHLQHTFTRIVDSDRIELVIDDECRDDVDRYLRDGFFDLQRQYYLDSSWPCKEQFDAVSKGGDGHFVFAATALGFIGDKEYANPQKRLDQLIGFLERVEGRSVTNPLTKLDLLYKRILSDIPDEIFPTTWRILAHFIYTREALQLASNTDFLYGSAQAFCNFINIDQATFYNALRQLYSVIDVPPPEQAATTPIQQFAIKRDHAFIDITTTLLYWNEVGTRHFHFDETVMVVSHRDWIHNHACLPGMKWTSGMDALSLSKKICKLSDWSWTEYIREKPIDLGLLSHMLQLDLRYHRTEFGWVHFVLSTGFCRTKPSNEFDTKLLDNLREMTGQEDFEPASFPLRWVEESSSQYREFLLAGYGDKSIVVWYTNCDQGEWRLDRMNCDQVPSPDMISEYQEWLRQNRWYAVVSEESQDGSDSDSETSEYYSESEGLPTPGGTETEEEDVSSHNEDSREGD
ncbi:hypothetical protein NP233_g2211 [Leucocoprinus birnbaumii]|uniref:Nephrocystin 3-like N-terminal domain-containing protein n=1 Tax=Leucocoprinus birnbaumii TaxID=56174 RepID=A0AAD5YV41_9AGAR|nr:hypothetical protein NP233_g2211 [Leucocoprinus birnbaumii]